MLDIPQKKVAPHHNFTDKDRWKYSVGGGGNVYMHECAFAAKSPV